MKRILLLVVSLIFSVFLSAQNETGIYKTKEDFFANRLILADKITEELNSKCRITTTVGGEEKKYLSTSIWGYRLNGYLYRTQSSAYSVQLILWGEKCLYKIGYLDQVAGSPLVTGFTELYWSSGITGKIKSFKDKELVTITGEEIKAAKKILRAEMKEKWGTKGTEEFSITLPKTDQVYRFPTGVYTGDYLNEMAIFYSFLRYHKGSNSTDLKEISNRVAYIREKDGGTYDLLVRYY